MSSSVIKIVVMGVSGCGKSAVGQAVADHLGVAFADADDLHPIDNIEKMRQGIPLTDEDRMPWLESVAEWMDASASQQQSSVVACSALKRLYRDVLSASSPVLFVHLKGDFDLIHQRSLLREGHFMPPELLQSQFNALEEPMFDEAFVTVPIDDSLEAVIDRSLSAIKDQSLFQQSLI